MRKLRCLIVDDDVITGRLLKNMVSEYGACDEVGTGKKAIDSFKRAWDEGNPYDLVFLDIMMPEMDGQMALRAMREYESTRADIGEKSCRIIIMTVSREPHDVVEAYKNQCDGFMTKPIAKFQVDKVILQGQL